jgi:hypothetical protein
LGCVARLAVRATFPKSVHLVHVVGAGRNFPKLAPMARRPGRSFVANVMIDTRPDALDCARASRFRERPGAKGG